jgi:hypothetical protein
VLALVQKLVRGQKVPLGWERTECTQMYASSLLIEKLWISCQVAVGSFDLHDPLTPSCMACTGPPALYDLSLISSSSTTDTSVIGSSAGVTPISSSSSSATVSLACDAQIHKPDSGEVSRSASRAIAFSTIQLLMTCRTKISTPNTYVVCVTASPGAVQGSIDACPLPPRLF